MTNKAFCTYCGVESDRGMLQVCRKCSGLRYGKEIVCVVCGRSTRVYREDLYFKDYVKLCAVCGIGGRKETE